MAYCWGRAAVEHELSDTAHQEYVVPDAAFQAAVAALALLDIP